MKPILDTLAHLISIPSQNGIDTENNIGNYLESFLKDLGFEIQNYEYEKNRPNIIATYTFDKPGQTVLFNTHMDTKPAHNNENYNLWHSDPFSAVSKNDCIYGLGACDTKASIAVILNVLEQLIKHNCGSGKIVLNLVSDEENNSVFGTLPLCNDKKLSADLCVVMEPTDNTVCIGQLGNMFLKTTILGIGGHTGVPEGKINAFDIAIRYVHKLKEWALSKRIDVDDCQPFINIGKFIGGTSSGTIPSECEMYWGTRVLPKDSFEQYFEQIITLTKNFNDTSKQQIKVSTQLHDGGGVDGFICDSNSFQKLIDCSHKNYGIFGASSDAGFIYNKLKIPCCIFGPGSLNQAHSPDEFVKISQLEESFKILFNFLSN